MHAGKIRQMLIITDGCSNKGEDPVAMAALAKEQEITVNVIGVIDQDSIDEQGMREINGIAMSGGGVSQVVYSTQLSQTVQMVTRKAMTQTIHAVVNRELQQILGNKLTLEDLPPEKRGEVIEVVDELGEKSDLEVVILVDASASMKHKLQTVKEALIDLSISLNARVGKNQFSMLVFPGKRDDTEIVLDWTSRLESITGIFTMLSPGGITPTGPAIREAIEIFNEKRNLRSLLRHDDASIEESM
ncbi:VWA domain-containing protein [Neobacillus notoginsengisoli]|uniref:VWA domain-containing protein n=1 Tax=Neobacillus notoginsengisoli TaxID=1578198 RepID=A0A417YG67_9BACI|nr:VWA domain-containing protein [Neobacillus notoginsengisoli]RHW31818.1 VWA domain-containing protein [Neobacillus notoginsengisoli]